MSEFIQLHMDFVYFIYGLAFVFLGIVILTYGRKTSQHVIAGPLAFLGMFGILHGIHEWGVFWTLIRDPGDGLELFNLLNLILSYLALFEFGRRMMLLINISFVLNLGYWIYLPLAVLFMLISDALAWEFHGLNLASRYLLGLPGGLMAGLGIVAYANIYRQKLSSLIPLFYLFGFSLVTYALLAGAIPEEVNFFPANYINSKRFAELTATPVQLWRALCAIVLAISIRRLLSLFEIEIEEHQRLARRVLASTREGVMITDVNNVIQEVNPSFEKATGYSASEAIGQTPKLLHSGHQGPEFYQKMWSKISEQGVWQGEIWNRRKSGEVYPVWLTISAINDDKGNVSHYVGMFSDIAQQEHFQQQLHNLAYYDGLTGLPNRQLFMDRMKQNILQADRRNKSVALMFLDLDRFKTINDTLGHTAGDELLCAVARRLQLAVRIDDTVCRLGGDEFTLILPFMEDTSSPGHVAEKILAIFSDPFEISGREYFITPSIGISMFPKDGRDPNVLIMHADTAMYRAKANGRNNYQFYTQEMRETFHRRLSLENDLRRALDNDEFSLVYQPQVDFTTNAVIGAEALIRWHHPEHSWVSPMEFIPIAEESGLITHITELVLDLVCQQIKSWQAQGYEPVPVAVNISAKQFQNPKLAHDITQTLARTGINVHYLSLELTESALMDEPDAVVENMKLLSEQGIDVAIDDFGTGYSSLSYLKRLPLYKLKIDRSFVMDIPEDQNDMAIASTIIAMSNALNLRVIAEGVETQDQADFLKQEGCHEMQGYLFSKPLDADTFNKYLGPIQN